MRSSRAAAALFAAFFVAQCLAAESLSFAAGWNLAGNGLATTLDVKTSFASQASVRTVWKWDAALARWDLYVPTLDAATLEAYAQANNYGVLASIAPGEGYWVNASAPVSIGSASGTGYSLAAAALDSGWNLAATADDVTASALAASIGNVTSLWAWDEVDGVWYFYSPALAANNTLSSYIQGKGYRDFGTLGLGKGRGFWINYAGPANNVLPIVIDAGPGQAYAVNVPFVSVTICTPGGAACQSIDHIIVDTGSTGLRIISSVLSPELALTQQLAANGKPLLECTQFVDGYVWGPVKTADVRLAGKTLNGLAIQVIGDPAYPNVPRSCSSNGGVNESTVDTFGGNGILGVAVFQQDCGAVCAAAATDATYYSCVGTSCQAVAVVLDAQIQNPVGLLAADNNGVVIDLPAVAPAGAANVAGSLILGIGTKANNLPGNATVFALDPNQGTLTTVFKGRRYTGSFIDSGSNGLYFADASVAVCASGFFCPAATLQLTATNQGSSGASGAVNFSVANADDLFNGNNTAFGNLAGPSSDTSFDWGLPFFFGRRVYTAIEGRSTPSGSGPYVAY